MAIIGTILGNIGADARTVTLGQTMGLEFSIASRRGRKDKNGEKVTDWVDVILFRTAMQPYLTKGRSVMVTGELEFTTYQTRSGETKVGIKVVADKLELAGGPTADAEQHSYAEQPQSQQAQAPAPPPQQAAANDGGALPF